MRISILALLVLSPIMATEREVAVADGRAAQANGCPGADRVVAGVGFTSASRLAWEPPGEASKFNVYLGHGDFSSPSFSGPCLYSAVPEAATLLDGQPRPGRIWTLQVTGLFPEGEGPIGLTSDCKPLAPLQPCTCTLPADPGPCDAVVPRWFFDYETSLCQEFIWGGCLGNANNFETEAACQAVCLDPCRFPAVVGPCDALVPRWYFSVLSGHCEPFTWGGCGGNANNFPDEESCRGACGDRCELAPDPGPCDGVCPRWYYDPETGQCQTFIWGCCGGNANNFETQDACEAACPR